jgi:hypothetical protein
VELANTNEITKLEEYTIDANLEIKKLDMFEVVDEDYTNTLVQNILSLGHVIENNDKLLTIALKEGSQPLGLFHDAHFKEYNFPTLFYGHPRPSLACYFQKIMQVELININRKFAYHISNIYFKTIKVLIHFILFCAWICICKEKLLDLVLNASDVSTNVNLDKILKSNLGYKELSCIRTSLDYLDCLHKDVFVMIKQLGPPTFFMTFTTSVNNWLIFIKTLK